MGREQVRLFFNPLFVTFFFLFLCQITSMHGQLCTQEQSSTLLQFKQKISINKNVSGYCDASSSKIDSWMKGSDCCSWDGVDCDGETGQVIGLDLSCSRLQGTLHPNNSLFLSFPHLQMLNLAHNDFSMSPIPLEFTRFTELTHLNLSDCRFSGKVPVGISFLNKLVSLDLSANDGLRLEEGGFELLIQNLSKIRDLNLEHVNMSSSVVPNSLLNLTSLRTLNLLSSGLRGNFPGGIFHLPYLEELDIGDNHALTGYLPDFKNLSYPLKYLSLARTGFSSEFPRSVANLKSLEILSVADCDFHGSIPTSFWNLSQISYLDLSSNNFSGTLPSSISNLRNLYSIDLQNNSLTRPFFSFDANLTQLVTLDVSFNFLSGPLPSQVTPPPKLWSLSLGTNSLNGSIPSWVFKLPSLGYLDLSFNYLTGPLQDFQSASVKVLELRNNSFNGTIPISVFQFQNLTCFILSSNSFSGTIPEPNQFGRSMQVIELQMNNLSGTIHDSFRVGNSLKTINLNGNGFAGPIPKSLANCRSLEVLGMGRNKFIGKFPHWLANLPNLQVLILQSNKLYGSIPTTSETNVSFPKLRVLDLSNNNFSGPLPKKYFTKFDAMKNVVEGDFQLTYLSTGGFQTTYYDSLTMVIKGSTIDMRKILTIFAAIDLSRNKFEGEIPEIIGGLSSLRGLNLSHNSLTGHLPKSLGNLTKLEWLDLSSNMLTGEIPRQLANLNSLGTLKLSENRLTGPIPRGKQFDTFSNDSYINNLALCGPPLSKTCGDPEETQPPPATSEKDKDFGTFCWEVILPGYGLGVVIGLVVGYLMFTFGKPLWLVDMVEDVGNRNGKWLKRNAWRHGGRRN